MERLKLLEDSKLQGTSFEKFHEVVKDIDNRTHAAEMQTSLLKILSVISTENVGKGKEKWCAYVIDENALKEFNRNFKKPPIGGIDKSNIPEDLWNEMLRGPRVIMMSDPVATRGAKPFIISQQAMTSLLRPLKISGSGMIVRNNNARNIDLADAILKENRRIKVLYRDYTEKVGKKWKTYWKVFSFFSAQDGKHVMIPQGIIPDTISYLKQKNDIRSKEWTVTNYITEIVCELPEIQKKMEKEGIADVMPELLFKTSDVGKSSLEVQGMLRLGDGAPILISELNQAHKYNFDITAFLAGVEDIIEMQKTYCKKITVLPQIPFQYGILLYVEEKLRENKKIPKKTTVEIMKGVRALLRESKKNELNMYDMMKMILESIQLLKDDGINDVTYDVIIKTISKIPDVIMSHENECAKKDKKLATSKQKK